MAITTNIIQIDKGIYEGSIKKINEVGFKLDDKHLSSVYTVNETGRVYFNGKTKFVTKKGNKMTLFMRHDMGVPIQVVFIIGDGINENHFDLFSIICPSLNDLRQVFINKVDDTIINRINIDFCRGIIKKYSFFRYVTKVVRRKLIFKRTITQKKRVYKYETARFSKKRIRTKTRTNADDFDQSSSSISEWSD